MSLAKRKTVTDIINSKSKQNPLVCLTAYTAPFAKRLDEHCDVLLVGDSLGMVLYGMDSTLPVTLEMMMNHGKAVVNASHQACVVVDMPFGTYEASKEKAFESAAYLMKATGCQAVKLEGGMNMASTIRFLTERSIPVMAHIGLCPQSVNIIGGYKCQGNEPSQAELLLKDAQAVADAGAFSVVLECANKNVADDIVKAVNIPVIGIGASPTCDGQILVSEDMLGMTGSKLPRFVKQYADIGSEIDKAVAHYAQEVRSRCFPTNEHCYFNKTDI